jgi:type II secretory pathway pseudopilin PulG
LAKEGEQANARCGGPVTTGRGFTLVAMMIAVIIAGLGTLFLVSGFFTTISDEGRIVYSAESDT